MEEYCIFTSKTCIYNRKQVVQHKTSICINETTSICQWKQVFAKPNQVFLNINYRSNIKTSICKIFIAFANESEYFQTKTSIDTLKQAFA